MGSSRVVASIHRAEEGVVAVAVDAPTDHVPHTDVVDILEDGMDSAAAAANSG